MAEFFRLFFNSIIKKHSNNKKQLGKVVDYPFGKIDFFLTPLKLLTLKKMFEEMARNNTKLIIIRRTDC